MIIQINFPSKFEEEELSKEKKRNFNIESTQRSKKEWSKENERNFDKKSTKRSIDQNRINAGTWKNEVTAGTKTVRLKQKMISIYNVELLTFS